MCVCVCVCLFELFYQFSPIQPKLCQDTHTHTHTHTRARARTRSRSRARARRDARTPKFPPCGGFNIPILLLDSIPLPIRRGDRYPDTFRWDRYSRNPIQEAECPRNTARKIAAGTKPNFDFISILFYIFRYPGTEGGFRYPDTFRWVRY